MIVTRAQRPNYPRPTQVVKSIVLRPTYRYTNKLQVTTLVRPKSSLFEAVETSTYLVGKGIILFTMFYCTLNWMHYRDARIRAEKEKDSGNGNDDTAML